MRRTVLLVVLSIFLLSACNNQFVVVENDDETIIT